MDCIKVIQEVQKFRHDLLEKFLDEIKSEPIDLLVINNGHYCGVKKLVLENERLHFYCSEEYYGFIMLEDLRRLQVNLNSIKFGGMV